MGIGMSVITMVGMHEYGAGMGSAMTGKENGYLMVMADNSHRYRFAVMIPEFETLGVGV
jgi:hypothetical protein